MLVICDEQLAKQIQQLAEREKRPVEDLLAEMVAHYPAHSTRESVKPSKGETVQRVRRMAYAKARQYWESVGDSTKAALTDEQLDAEFGAFDEEGIPRLKSELSSLKPPIGSLAYAAKVAARGDFRSGKPDLARRSEEILDEYFATI